MCEVVVVVVVVETVEGLLGVGVLARTSSAAASTPDLLRS